MRDLVLRSLLVVAALTLVLLAAPAQAQPAAGPGPAPIRALLITGKNNHNWQFTSRVHAETLAATGRFAVDITDDPATTLADAAKLAAYQLFVLDYNDNARWGAQAEKNFLARVNAGVGVVAVHGANNAFPDWDEYARLLGLVWRDGVSAHDDFGPFELKVTGADAITKGMPATVAVTDELYYGLVPFAKYSTLASATSKKSGKDEPIVTTGQYGPARVAYIALGHVWTGHASSKPSVCSPFFRALLSRTCEWAATGQVTLPVEWSDRTAHNQLSQQEKADGWTLLFDGKTTSGWRGFKSDKFPDKGWDVDAGTLRHVTNAGGGDIVADGDYADFELALEWTVAPGGNSGIMYRCAEEGKDYPWQTGPECQVLDDERHQDGKNKKTSAGSLYDVIAPPVDVVRPAGEWNSARIVCKGSRIEHWLNGFKVVDIDLNSDEFKAAKAQSKWKDSKDYASLAKGRIALQDHGDEVRYRNIKIRTLK